MRTHTLTHSQDFSETLALVEKYEFPSLFINQFYPRPGTPAARMKRVPTHKVKQRSRQLTQVNSFLLVDDSFVYDLL